MRGETGSVHGGGCFRFGIGIGHGRGIGIGSVLGLGLESKVYSARGVTFLSELVFYWRKVICLQDRHCQLGKVFTGS